MNIDISTKMGFGPSESSWLPNRETTVAICTTLIAALVAVYVYKSITQRSFHARTRHIANEVELVRLCEEIKDEPLSSLDRNIRQLMDSETTVVGPYTFYYKSESNEKSALVSACRYGRVDIVKYFLNNFSKCVHVSSTANLDLPVGRYHSMVEVHRCSALYAACFHGSIETVLHLLKSKADINQSDCLGRTPLQVAAQRGHMMLVQELLGKGADIDISDDHGYTPLLSAVSEKHIKVVMVLLEHEADLFHTTTDGHSALHIAAENGSKQLIELLLQYSPGLAKHYSYDHNHRLASPIKLAASRGHVSATQILMESAKLSPAQDPDVLLLWGSALLSPHHKYIQSSVKRYWIEALELREQHHLLNSTLTPHEVYEYRSEMSRIDDVIEYFSSNPSSTNTSPTSSTRDITTPITTPTKLHDGANLDLSSTSLSSTSTIYLTADGTTDVFYQSLIIFERCLGYGDPAVIKRLIEVSKYMLSKRKFHQANQLLCRSLEMSMDRITRYPHSDFCHHSEIEYEIKSMLRTLCDILSDLMAGGYADLRFSVYLNYLKTAFDSYANKEARYDCFGNPAKINEHVVLWMLCVLAAWVYYRNKIAATLHEDVNDMLELSEYEECDSLIHTLINQHMFICNGTTLLHLTLAKLGSRDSLVRSYPFLKDMSSFVTALLEWSDAQVANLASSLGDRPLHVASQRARSDQEAMQLISPLLKHGAHIDACNARGKTAAEMQRHKILRHNRPKCLTCLCYNKLIDAKMPCDLLPASQNFTENDKELLRLHDPEHAKVEYQNLFESVV